MALQEHTLAGGDTISDKIADDGTKTTTANLGGTSVSLTNSSIAEAAKEAKKYLNSAEITVTYDDATYQIKAIKYELTKD